jgi:RNA polymerase sigma-70 factor (ECF subfamily)
VESVSVYSFQPGRDEAHEQARAAEAISRRRRFENLIDRHERRLRRLTFGILTDPSRIDDVLQEAFIRAYRALPDRFESERQEAAWLYRIVHRCALNELRSVRRRRETPGLPEREAADATEVSLTVAAALAELSPESRSVVLLVDLIGFDYETVASMLRIPRGTVASRLNTARSDLRDAFTRLEAGPDA